MPATVIAERVGWTGSTTWFRENIRRLRPDHTPAVEWVWLGGDYYCRVDSTDYSVDPLGSADSSTLQADLSRVEIRHQGRLVAAHDRVWARGMTITDPVHASRVLREQHQQPRPTPEHGNWSAIWPTTNAPSAWSVPQPRTR